jgi:DNA polymerase-1
MGAIQKVYPDNCRRIDGLEADDVMSIIATDPKYTSEFDITIWSQDKDMKQVPGVYLDNTKDGVEFTSNHEANRFRYLQCLTGDPTDGYGGCPGYGPVGAAKYLDNVGLETEGDYLDRVISAYMNAGKSIEFALSQINCAFILRHSEYNFKNKQPILVTR